MKRKRLLMTLTVCVLMILPSLAKEHVADTLANQDIIRQVDVSGLDTTDALIIDVRTEAEFSEEHLPGALHMNVNQPDFKEKIQLLSKDKPVLVYCRSGGRSMKAAELMEELGFKAIYNLEGGMIAWKKEQEKL